MELKIREVSSQIQQCGEIIKRTVYFDVIMLQHEYAELQNMIDEKGLINVFVKHKQVIEEAEDNDDDK